VRRIVAFHYSGVARAGLDGSDKSALAILGLAVVGGLLWMRSKGQ